MATEDRNGDLHDEKNGQYTSKRGASSSESSKKRKKIRTVLASGMYLPLDRYGALDDIQLDRMLKELNPSVVFASNGVLPKEALENKEWAEWYSCVADIKSGLYMPKDKKGFLIQIEKKIVVTRGNCSKPKAVACLSFESKEHAHAL